MEAAAVVSIVFSADGTVALGGADADLRAGFQVFQVQDLVAIQIQVVLLAVSGVVKDHGSAGQGDGACIGIGVNAAADGGGVAGNGSAAQLQLRALCQVDSAAGTGCGVIGDLATGDGQSRLVFHTDGAAGASPVAVDLAAVDVDENAVCGRAAAVGDGAAPGHMVTVAGNLAAVHIEGGTCCGRGTQEDGCAGAGLIRVCRLAAGDGAVVEIEGGAFHDHDSCAVVVDTAHQLAGVGGAIGDGQRTYIQLENTVSAGLGDGMAVQAQIQLTADRYCAGQGHIGGQTVVAATGQGGGRFPLHEAKLFMVRAACAVANAMVMGDGSIQHQGAVPVCQLKCGIVAEDLGSVVGTSLADGTVCHLSADTDPGRSFQLADGQQVVTGDVQVAAFVADDLGIAG